MNTSYEKFCCVFLFLFQLILRPVEAFSSRTFNGKFFVNHELKTVPVNDWIGCTNRCFEEPSCISYNYNEKRKICMLNDHGVEDLSYTERQLVEDRGWVFHQIRVWMTLVFLLFSISISFYFLIF